MMKWADQRVGGWVGAWRGVEVASTLCAGLCSEGATCLTWAAAGGCQGQQRMRGVAHHKGLGACCTSPESTRPVPCCTDQVQGGGGVQPPDVLDQLHRRQGQEDLARTSGCCHGSRTAAAATARRRQQHLRAQLGQVHASGASREACLVDHVGRRAVARQPAWRRER